MKPNGPRRWLWCGLVVLAGSPAAVQAEPPVIPVWPGTAPGSERWTRQEVEYLNPQMEKMVRNVVSPTLHVLRPDPARATSTAVVVCPGGGFRFLSWQTEGTDAAEWLAARGVTAFVLRYRLVDTGATEAELARVVERMFDVIREGPRAVAATENIGALARDDGLQAVRTVRQEASRFGVDPDRIGVLGFSAGATIAIGTGLTRDPAGRPRFVAPIYGLRIDDAPVPDDAPALFAVATSDDPLVPPAETTRVYAEWTAARRPAELHVYAKGGHGFGMNKQNLPVDHWIDRFAEWLEAQGLLAAAR